MVSGVKVLEQSAEALFVPCRIGLDSLLEQRSLYEPILDRQGNGDEGRGPVRTGQWLDSWKTRFRFSSASRQASSSIVCS